MHKISIGLLRNLLKKREQLKPIIKQIILADDFIVITNTKNSYAVSGITESEARTVHMLGSAIGSNALAINQLDPSTPPVEYINQVSHWAHKAAGVNQE